MIEGIPGIVARFYNAFAARAFGEFYRKIASEIFREISSGRILDVGTGPGYLPLEITRTNARLSVVGVDVSPTMIEIARKNTIWAGMDRIRFEVADVHNLPYEDNSFDFLVSTISFHHWRNKKCALSECYRILKNGGCGWIYDLRKDAGWKKAREIINGYSLPALYLSFAARFHGLRTRDFYEELKDVLEQIKFREVSLSEEGPFIRIRLKK